MPDRVSRAARRGRVRRGAHRPPRRRAAGGSGHSMRSSSRGSGWQDRPPRSARRSARDRRRLRRVTVR
ncbi:hypothetical protein D3228_05550 [Leucobacter luti]|nr:hypothetical protein [Leucobacter luti]